MHNQRIKELTLLELAEIGIQNSQKISEISKAMALFGYDEEKLIEGQELFLKAKGRWQDKQRGSDTSREAFHTFSTTKEKLKEYYKSDRKRAKLIFQKEMVILNRLSLDGRPPKAFLTFLATAQKLYTELKANETLLRELSRMQFTSKLVDERLALIEEVKSLQADYYREKAVSEEATRIKNEILSALEQWLSAFHATAKIALTETPQYLEALGIVTK